MEMHVGKLAEYMALKRDLASDFEHELRAVRDVILGARRISGKELTIDFGTGDGFVSGTRARATFIRNFRTQTHEALLQYAHDLAIECMELGLPQHLVEEALGGDLIAFPHRQQHSMVQADVNDSPAVRLAYTA
jgi:hypothetical protein